MTPEEQAAVDALKKEHDQKVASLQAEITKANERVENAQKKINEWGNEVGELRKTKEEAEKMKADLAAAKAEAEKLKADLTKLSSAGPKGGQGQGNEQEDTETSDELEAKLNDEQRKLVDDIYKKADPKDKAALREDEKFRKQFLKKVLKDTSSTPDSFFRSTPDKQKTRGDDVEDRLAKLFNQKKKRSSFTPEGPSGGSAEGGGSLPEGGGDDEETRPTYTGGDINQFFKNVRESSAVS